MKLTTLTLAAAAIALLGASADAQQPAAPTPGSVTGAATAEPLAPAPTASAASTSETPAAPAASADVAATATFTNVTVTNGPVPDTAENRAKYGQPMSNAGKRTAAKGN